MRGHGRAELYAGHGFQYPHHNGEALLPPALRLGTL
jgi:hypothetical protein